MSIVGCNANVVHVLCALVRFDDGFKNSRVEFQNDDRDMISSSWRGNSSVEKSPANRNHYLAFGQCLVRSLPLAQWYFIQILMEY